MNTLYEIGPASFQNFFFNSVTPPSFDFHWRLRVGNRVGVLVPVSCHSPRSWYFALSYKWHERGTRGVEAILNDHLERSKYFVDIGANLGLRSIYSLSIGRPCIMVEPNLDLHNFTRELCRINGFQNWKIASVGLSDRIGAASFYISKTSYLSSLDIEWATNDGGDPVPIGIELQTLASLLSQFEVPYDRVGLIKIDAEGSEVSVLKGAETVLRLGRPAVICEVSSRSVSLVTEFMATLGYGAYFIQETPVPVLLPSTSFQFAERFEGVVPHNILLLPEENIGVKNSLRQLIA